VAILDREPMDILDPTRAKHRDEAMAEGESNRQVTDTDTF
jgi:hypothetical protein